MTASSQPLNSGTPSSEVSAFSFQPSAFSGLFAGKKIWLSGVSGFKGSWLAEWLLMLGAEVRGFSLPPPTSPSLFDQLGLASRITWDCGDLRDPVAVKESLLACDPDFVFHLAAQPLVRLSYSEPVETWETNVMGTIHVLDALRLFKRGNAEALSASPQHLALSSSPPGSSPISDLPSPISHTPAPSSPHPLVAVFITTDKCYENREWLHGYREEDALGGYDPYSSSKAAAEVAIASWRRSFFLQHPSVRIASARAGNVIGGGDWAQDRIVPDSIRALAAGQRIPVRNKSSTRPWQHVLEPLSGYLALASHLQSSVPYLQSSAAPGATAFNFGPALSSNRNVEELVREILKHWPGGWEDKSDPRAPHEAGKLNLATDKAFHLLGWQPRWDFQTTIAKTVGWYRSVSQGANPGELTRQQIQEYEQGN